MQERRVYRVEQPVRVRWFYLVEASSQAEALRIVDSGEVEEVDEETITWRGRARPERP